MGLPTQAQECYSMIIDYKGFLYVPAERHYS